jgi:hypothetical protein
MSTDEVTQAGVEQSQEEKPLPEGADPELAQLRGKERGDKIREMYDNGNGMKRGDIAKLFGIAYQQVYAYTKPPEGERQGRGKVILPSGQPRAEYIREQAEAGRTRAEIANELGVAYQIVYAATKGMQVTPGRQGGGGSQAQGTEPASPDAEVSLQPGDDGEEESLFEEGSEQ